MTDAPDPKTVRALARKFLLDDDLTADELDYVVYSHTGYGVGHEEFQAWRDAVDADAQAATVTKTAAWPDEQPQDDGDVRAVAAYLAERAANGAASAVLYARFADRIAALEARDAKAGEQR